MSVGWTNIPPVSLRIFVHFLIVAQRSSMADTIDKTSYKVCLVGASGGIGQVLALLLKINPKISELSLYDVVNTMGVAADLSHVSTTTKITGYVGSEQLDAALIGSDVVVVVAGIPRKPGMSRDDLFDINSKIVYGIAESCARICPTAMFLIVSNPVNSNVPIFAEVLRSYREPPCSVHALIHHKPHVLGVYNARKLLGVTTLDTVRTNTFVSELVNLDVRNVNVRVIGGHTNTTILPLLSQISSLSLSEEEICKLTSRIRNAGDEVVAAKDGAGSATLSMVNKNLHL